MKVVENLSRKDYGETLNYWKDIYCRYLLELPLWVCESTVYVTETKETSFNVTFKPSTMFIVYAYFKHLKLSISIRIPVATPQIV